MFDSKTNCYSTENQTYFISLRENERQLLHIDLLFIGNAKNLRFSQKLNSEVVARAICLRDRPRSLQ